MARFIDGFDAKFPPSISSSSKANIHCLDAIHPIKYLNKAKPSIFPLSINCVIQYIICRYNYLR